MNASGRRKNGQHCTTIVRGSFTCRKSGFGNLDGGAESARIRIFCLLSNLLGHRSLSNKRGYRVSSHNRFVYTYKSRRSLNIKRFIAPFYSRIGIVDENPAHLFVHSNVENRTVDQWSNFG